MFDFFKKKQKGEEEKKEEKNEKKKCGGEENCPLCHLSEETIGNLTRLPRPPNRRARNDN